MESGVKDRGLTGRLGPAFYIQHSGCLSYFVTPSDGCGENHSISSADEYRFFDSWSDVEPRPIPKQHASHMMTDIFQVGYVGAATGSSSGSLSVASADVIPHPGCTLLIKSRCYHAQYCFMPLILCARVCGTNG